MPEPCLRIEAWSSKPAGGLEQVERERLRRDARDAELKAQHFEARAATLQQVRHAVQSCIFARCGATA